MATPKVVNGKVVGPDGVAKSGASVVAVLSQPALVTGTSEVVPTTLSTTTDSTGAYTFSLYSTADLTPSNTFYTIREMPLDGGTANWTVVVPQTAGPFVVSSILSGTPSSGVYGGHVSTLTVDALTAGDVVYADTAGLAATDATLTFNKGTKVLGATGIKVGTGGALFAGTDPWVDVTHPSYGADSTGALDSAPAINLALASGAAVFIPFGANFTINSNLTPSTPYQRIFGAGMRLTTIKGNFNSIDKMFELAAAAIFVTIENLSINGNGADFGVYCDDNAVNLTLRLVEIRNCTGQHLGGGTGYGFNHADHAYQMSFERVYINGNSVGVALQKHSEGSVFDRCLIYNNLTSQMNLGDDTGALWNITLEGCQVTSTIANATASGIVAKQVRQLNLIGHYSESNSVNATCLTVSGSAFSQIKLDGGYMVGNSVANYAITIAVQTYLSVANSTFIHFLQLTTTVPINDTSGNSFILKTLNTHAGNPANFTNTSTDPTLSIGAGGASIAGALSLADAASQIVPGATSLSLRNNANSADNLLITDAGAVTARAGLTATAGGMTITAGDLNLATSSLIRFGGTNLADINASALRLNNGGLSGGVKIGSGALSMIGGPFVGALTLEVFSGAITVTVDGTKGNTHKIPATSNTASTLTPSAAGTAGQWLWLLFTSDGTGGNVITFASTFKPNGTLTLGVSKTQIVGFLSDGTNWWEWARGPAL